MTDILDFMKTREAVVIKTLAELMPLGLVVLPIAGLSGNQMFLSVSEKLYRELNQVTINKEHHEKDEENGEIQEDTKTEAPTATGASGRQAEGHGNDEKNSSFEAAGRDSGKDSEDRQEDCGCQEDGWRE